jgi:hypothetical protein
MDIAILRDYGAFAAAIVSVAMSVRALSVSRSIKIEAFLAQRDDLILVVSENIARVEALALQAQMLEGDLRKLTDPPTPADEDLLGGLRGIREMPRRQHRKYDAKSLDAVPYSDEGYQTLRRALRNERRLTVELDPEAVRMVFEKASKRIAELGARGARASRMPVEN